MFPDQLRKVLFTVLHVLCRAFGSSFAECDCDCTSSRSLLTPINPCRLPFEGEGVVRAASRFALLQHSCQCVGLTYSTGVAFRSNDHHFWLKGKCDRAAACPIFYLGNVPPPLYFVKKASAMVNSILSSGLHNVAQRIIGRPVFVGLPVAGFCR